MLETIGETVNGYFAVLLESCWVLYFHFNDALKQEDVEQYQL